MKNETKKYNKLLEESEAILLFTDKGCYVKGITPELLSLYSSLTKEMMNLKGMDKEKLDLAYELAFKSGKELLETLSDVLKEAINKIKED